MSEPTPAPAPAERESAVVHAQDNTPITAPLAAAPAAQSVEAFAADNGISRSAAWTEIAAGRLTARRTGRRTLILREDAERWRASLVPWVPDPRRTDRARRAGQASRIARVARWVSA